LNKIRNENLNRLSLYFLNQIDNPYKFKLREQKFFAYFAMTRSIKLLTLIGVLPSWNALSTPYGTTARNIATQILQGAGPAKVDMNKYNIPLDQVEEAWRAQLVQKAAEKSARLRLACKNERELFVDTILVTFERVQDAGLGLILLELAGGRSDELGITVVSEVMSEGPTDGLGIMIGDSISKVSLMRRAKTKEGATSLTEEFEEFSVDTECLGYSATVDSISSLPKYDPNYSDRYELTIKRIRRKPKVSIKLQYPPEQNEPDTVIELFAGENLRQGMLIRNVKLNDPLAKRFDTKTGGNCGAGGLCRTCAVSVSRGVELLNPQRVAEKQMLEDQPRWRLACKAIVGFGMQEGNMTIQVNPRQWN